MELSVYPQKHFGSSESLRILFDSLLVKRGKVRFSESRNQEVPGSDVNNHSVIVTNRTVQRQTVDLTFFIDNERDLIFRRIKSLNIRSIS